MSRSSPKKTAYLPYNKTRHSYIYIYAAYSRPNGWTEWADIFCRHSWVAGGCFGLKIIGFFQNFNLFSIFLFLFFYGQRQAFNYYFIKKIKYFWIQEGITTLVGAALGEQQCWERSACLAGEYAAELPGIKIGMIVVFLFLLIRTGVENVCNCSNCYVVKLVTLACPIVVEKKRKYSNTGFIYSSLFIHSDLMTSLQIYWYL